MRILMVCQHYWPEHFQVTEVCEELVARGHEVTALVGIPNYPTGIVPPEYHNGQNREESHNGVKIIRVEEVPRKPGVLGLARNYLSYPREARKAVRSLGEGYDVVFAYQLSPVFMAAPAVDYKKVFGVPVLLYCADIWPDAVLAMLPALARPVLPLIGGASSRIYRGCDLIATNSAAYVDGFEQVHGISRERLRYMPQYADDGYLDVDLAAPKSNVARFMLMGNIGKLQDMGCVMEAIRLLGDRDDFVFHIVGTGSVASECERFAAENGLGERVVFHGRHPVESMPDFYRMADACVLSLNVPGAPWISSTLPSRLQGYMAAGKPILAAINGSAAQVIEESGCGRSVSAGDATGLAALMADFIDNRAAYAGCGEAGRTYFRENFMRKRYMDGIEDLLLKTAGREQK